MATDSSRAFADPARAPAPVGWLPGEDEDEPEDGWALCLSGGGYRAMLFHAGTLLRLNEAGLLAGLQRVSSVSGGSIAAAALGWRWEELKRVGFSREALEAEVVARLRALARRTIDIGSGVLGLFSPGSIADQLVEHYEDHLFEGARPTLQDLPGDPPRFVLNSTNLESGALWRFSRPYMGDYRVGLVSSPRLELATAVAASSAFPPFLSPLDLRIDPDAYDPLTGDRDKDPDLVRDSFRASPRLTDGGVYDNLGLETAYKRYRNLLVSDGGGKMGADEDVDRDWVRQLMRIGDVVDNQVRSLRKRLLIASFELEVGGRPLRNGAYWSLRTDPAKYTRVKEPLLPPEEQVARARAVPTRLKALDEETQEGLINWGYCACDLAIRSFVKPMPDPPAGLPHP